MQMGRRLATSLTSTPYLRWTWYLEPAIFGGGPGVGLERGVRVVVYFRNRGTIAVEDINMMKG
jgi:hypothetical protein